MLFICYPRCSTCKRAAKWLDDNGLEYEFRDIKTDNPTPEEIEVWHQMSGVELKRFYNTSGNSYKNMNLRDKLKNMSEKEQYNLLGSDGMLVKRPLLVDGANVFVGFCEEL